MFRDRFFVCLFYGYKITAIRIPTILTNIPNILDIPTNQICWGLLSIYKILLPGGFSSFLVSKRAAERHRAQSPTCNERNAHIEEMRQEGQQWKEQLSAPQTHDIRFDARVNKDTNSHKL